MFENLQEKLQRAFKSLRGQAVLSEENISEALKQIRLALLEADVNFKVVKELIDRIQAKAVGQEVLTALSPGEQVIKIVRDELVETLGKDTAKLKFASQPPTVVLMAGLQGSGKTTTSGKLANLFTKENRSVLLCAADTFRAAAIEQLEVWASRSGVEMIKTRQGGDPAAVLYDAVSAAKARGIGDLYVDTAGRLHTKTGLMDELEKMRRTAARLVPEAPHEVLLVMDATTGQNGLQQARLFTAAAGVTGIVLTKLDGTAKGGIAVAIARELDLPVISVTHDVDEALLVGAEVVRLERGRVVAQGPAVEVLAEERARMIEVLG